MSVIIEGQNGIGKSTFCEYLRQYKLKNHDIIHLTQTFKNDFKTYNKLLYNKKLILDRGPLGELVYSDIYGRKPRITVHEVNALLRNTPCVVLWNNNSEEIKANLIAKGESDNPECNIEFINEERRLFKFYMDKIKNISIIPYNFKYMRLYIQLIRG